MATSRILLPSQFPQVWLTLIGSTKPLLGPRPEDRGFDQYLEFRDKTFALVLDDRFVAALDRHLVDQLLRSQRVLDLREDFGRRLFEALMEEMRACARASEVTQATMAATSTSEDQAKAKKAQLSKLSITLGSLKDVIGEVPWLKTSVGLFKELVDFCK